MSIKIEFSGLSFFPDTSFKDSTNVDYRMIPVDDNAIQKSTEWNGNSEVVQSIFYDSYKLTFLLRENKKQGFQKIKYAPKITITNLENSEVINAKFRDLSFDSVADNLEFYKCTFEFDDIASKNIQNNHKNNAEVFKLSFSNAPAPQFLFNSNFSPIFNSELSVNEVNNFKDQVIDYNKKSTVYRFLLFVENSELDYFFQNMQNVAEPTAKSKLSILDKDNIVVVANTYQYELVNSELFGENLQRIEMNLITDNTISYPYN